MDWIFRQLGFWIFNLIFNFSSIVRTFRQSVCFSFPFTAEEVTFGIDASCLTAIVTGGSSGIGAETARILALRGAQVVIAARNVAAGEKLKQTILKHNSNARVHVLELDLSSMESVRKFSDDFKSMTIPLNILINNAGIAACPFQLSVDGIEMQFATNHIGHFLLTNLLLDNLRNTSKETGIEGRIVNVASAGHQLFTYPGGIRFDKLNDESSYSAWSAYAQSKLANILHANELARRLQEEGANVTANSLHPGGIRTNITRHHRYLDVVQLSTSFLWKSIPQGAATQCFLALHPSLKGVSGKYFIDCKEAQPMHKARDPKFAKALWKISEKLTFTKDKEKYTKEKTHVMNSNFMEEVGLFQQPTKLRVLKK